LFSLVVFASRQVCPLEIHTINLFGRPSKI
jgi:hypothetical protein